MPSERKPEAAQRNPPPWPAPLDYYRELPEARAWDPAAEAARRHLDEPAPPLEGAWRRGQTLILWTARLVMLLLLLAGIVGFVRLLLNISRNV